MARMLLYTYTYTYGNKLSYHNKLYFVCTPVKISSSFLCSKTVTVLIYKHMDVYDSILFKICCSSAAYAFAFSCLVLISAMFKNDKRKAIQQNLVIPLIHIGAKLNVIT